MSLNWTEEYAGMTFDYFGRLYLKVDKRNGEALIVYRFGRITDPPHSGLFKYHLEGSGEWYADGVSIITSVGEFTIYELSWKGRKGSKAKYDPRWTGLLTFTIEITPV